MSKQLLLFLILMVGILSAQKDDSKVRDAAIDNVGSVLFDTKVGQARVNTKKFEDQTSIKLHYKVDEQSLDQIGGLSEYLFKVFQSITAPVNMNARTIIGEFSTIKNNALTDTMHYETLVSQDLQRCLVPLQEAEKIGEIANKIFKESQKAENNYNTFPDQLEPVLSGLTWQYFGVVKKNYDACENDTSVFNSYGRHVAHTKVKRYEEWNNDVLTLSTKVLEMEDTQISAAVATTTIAALTPEQKHIACLNNALSECSLKDLNEQGEILFRHTGQHLYYLTANVEYYIPKDSLQLLVNQVAERLFQFDATAKYVVALWLQMHDGSDGKYTSALLVAQNGSYLTNGDIASSKSTYGSKYRDAAYHIYNALYAGLPKPVIIAYQVLKANGLATTVYFKKATVVKGLSRIYINVLKHDRILEVLNNIEQDISNATVEAEDCKTCYTAALKKARLREEKRNLLAEASIKSDLIPGKVKFKESYLINHDRAGWALDQWKKKEFSLVFKEAISGSVANYLDGEKGFVSGTCDKEVDVLMDVLAASSILLSPLDLDFIPDALTVAYCISKDDYVGASKNGIFLFIPGNVYAVKRILREPPEIIDAVNHGAKLLSEGGTLKALDPEQELILNSYKIPSEQAPNLPKDISADINTARALITKEHAVMHQIADELPLEKRIEFIHNFLHDKSFSKKCMDDPAEVWRWANKIDEINGIKRAEFLSSVKEFSNAAVGEKAWYLFSNKRFDELEDFIKSENLNGQYPPMDGFLNIQYIKTGQELEDMVFDRFQNTEILSGGFASPLKGINKELAYSYDSRALKYEIAEGTTYLKFRIKKGVRTDLKFTFGEAIPWFDKIGGAMQIKSSISFKDLVEGIDFEYIERKIFKNGKWEIL